MMVLVSYDVAKSDDGSGAKRLRKVAKVCESWGQRVQYSVFECLVDPAQLVKMKNQLFSCIDIKNDSLRFYLLGSNWKKRVEHLGAKKTYDPEGPLVI